MQNFDAGGPAMRAAAIFVYPFDACIAVVFGPATPSTVSEQTNATSIRRMAVYVVAKFRILESETRRFILV